MIDNSRGWGGAEQMLLSLSTAMRSRGHDVDVFLREGAATVEPFLREGFAARPIPRRGLGAIAGAFRVIGAARRGRYDLVHVHRNHDLIVGKLAALAGGAPLLLTQHCLLGSTSAGHIGLADRIVAVSRFIEADMEKRYPSLAGRLETIHNGIDLSPFDRLRGGYWRNVPALARARPLLGVVGYFYKNQEELIGLLPRIREKLPDAMLVVIGRDDPKRENLERAARECGVSDAVHFAGRVPHAEIGDALAGLDFNVSAFRKEGCALNVIESLAAGTPFVGYRAGSYPELVVEGETGMLADTPGEFVRILCDLAVRPAAMAGMREKARADARERFDAVRMVDRYEELYRRIGG